MNHNPLHFFKELLQRPIYEVIWVGYMMVLNLFAIQFWDELLAKIIIIVFVASSMLMMGLYSRYGFSKILGLGHILWVPLVIYIAISISGAGGLYLAYLIVLLITLSVSLMIDIHNVWSYFKEEAKY